jgi:hypothetical protein
MTTAFGELLREKRRAAVISQSKLAVLVGVYFSYNTKH